MAAKTIKVDPEQLRTWATEISNLGGDYQSNFQRVQASVDELAQAWTGDDSTSFRNKAHEFDDDFNKMFDEINQYVDYLNTAAQKYDEVRMDAQSRANALKGDYR